MGGEIHRRKRAVAQLPSSLAGGAHFSCVDCGICCSGAPGKVRVSEAEIRRISEYRNEAEADLRERVLRTVKGEALLKEQANGDCVFFKNNRCEIHAVKPRQCRTYPFWFQNVRSDRSWRNTCAECPGIGQGEWWPPERIVDLIGEELSS